MESKASGISFGFSKVRESKVLVNQLGENNTKVSGENELLIAIEENRIKSSKPTDEKKDLIIPLIKHNRWRKARKPEDLEKDNDVENVKEKTVAATGDDATDNAVNEILQEAAAQEEKWQSRNNTDLGLEIPILMKNKVPEGYEEDEKLDVTLRPDEAEEADYDTVPIDQYGTAMLRGMGWKPGQGIGRKAKHAKPVQAIVRPKGLGLGADRSLMLQTEKDKKNGSIEDEENVMKRGCHCIIVVGRHNGFYGTVEGLDGDNARAVVRLAVSNDVLTISQHAVQLVSKKEFVKKSQDKPDKKQERKSYTTDNDRNEREQKREKCKKDDKDSDNAHRHSHKHKRHKNSHNRHTESSHHKRERDRSELEESSTLTHHDVFSSSNKDLQERLWVRPNLRVRVIDPEYKKGNYYKKKVIIEDVLSVENCVCRTEKGDVIEDLPQQMLETVIPRSENSHVMVIKGPDKGQIAVLLRRNKETCMATLQLLSNRDKVIVLSYDDICEYMGDIDMEFDF